MSATATDQPIEGTASGPNPDTGKMFEIPRAKVTIDETDPNVLKLSFSGTVELDRASPDQVAFYNNLKAGREADLKVTVYVAGPQNTHRRDSEGNVDAVVQTKSLRVTDVVHSG
jgi:hypothetical protein